MQLASVSYDSARAADPLIPIREMTPTPTPKQWLLGAEQAELVSPHPSTAPLTGFQDAVQEYTKHDEGDEYIAIIPLPQKSECRENHPRYRRRDQEK